MRYSLVTAVMNYSDSYSYHPCDRLYLLCGSPKLQPRTNGGVRIATWGNELPYLLLLRTNHCACKATPIKTTTKPETLRYHHPNKNTQDKPV